MHLDLLNTQVSARSILALDKLLDAVDISKVKKNIRVMTALFMLSEQSELIGDPIELMLDLKYVFDFLEVLEQEDQGGK